MDLQGNVLDPATGFVDFAATFAIAVEEAALEIEFRYSVPWYRRLWSWVFAALQFRIS